MSKIRDYVAETDFDEMFAFTRELISEPPYAEAHTELAAYPNRECTAKVIVGGDGRLIGYCAATYPYWNNVAQIDYLIVAKDVRSRGLGTRLVRSVESVLCQRGIRHVCVQTASWNTDGIRFYERLGYARMAVLPEYFGKGNDAVWLGHDTPAA